LISLSPHLLYSCKIQRRHSHHDERIPTLLEILFELSVPRFNAPWTNSGFYLLVGDWLGFLRPTLHGLLKDLLSDAWFRFKKKLGRLSRRKVIGRAQ
jgi:hypothetical protein